MKTKELYRHDFEPTHLCPGDSIVLHIRNNTTGKTQSTPPVKATEDITIDQGVVFEFSSVWGLKKGIGAVFGE